MEARPSPCTALATMCWQLIGRILKGIVEFGMHSKGKRQTSQDKHTLLWGWFEFKMLWAPHAIKTK